MSLPESRLREARKQCRVVRQHKEPTRAERSQLLQVEGQLTAIIRSIEERREEREDVEVLDS